MKRVVWCLLAAGCSGEFDVGTPDLLAEIEGRLVRNGDVVPSARVSLHRDRDPIAQVRSDAGGRFRIGVRTEGRLKLAVHAGEGIGALLDVVATPGVRADVGTLELRPLHERPEVLALRGLGYEERVTGLPSSDGQLYATSLDEGRQLLLVSATQEGIPVVLTSALDMAETATTVSWPTLAPAEATSYAVRLRADEAEPVVYVRTFADGGEESRDWLVGPDRATVIDQGERRRIIGLYDDGLEITVLWQGDLTEGPQLALERWNREGERVLTRSLHDLGRPASWPSVGVRHLLVWDPGSATPSVSALDLWRLTVEPCGPQPSFEWSLTTNDDATLAVFADQQTRRIVRIDDQGCRVLAEVVVSASAGWPRLVEDTLYLVAGASFGLWAVDVKQGDVAYIDRGQVDDADLQACLDASPGAATCELAEVWDDRIRLSVRPCPSESDFCMVDVYEDSSSRSVPLVSSVTLRTELHSSDGGRWDVWTRPVDNGPIHAFLAPGIGVGARFRQATWFPRDHFFLAFGPSQRWLYTVMRDPRDDRVQVFRVPVELQ